ncbi:MAG: YggS family pyridoxal phosphate-dependent enzyme [Bacteroidales bacterium]|nr:YggS family pyridoxal phosphate-dependent enzyme [Bacteroidales bacterium]
MIAHKLSEILKQIPPNITLVAVSKTHPEAHILEAYQAGQRIFGENKVQELTTKQQNLPKDIQWHFIGHLQTNKVKYIAPFIGLVHGVESLKLLKAINKEALKNNRVIDCLLQFHIAREETKFGLNQAEASEMLLSEGYKTLSGVNIRGVMGMASFTNDENSIKGEFKNLKCIFESLKSNFFSTKADFNIVSMGMSGDYRLAIQEGSNMIRVGSHIFGERHQVT